MFQPIRAEHSNCQAITAKTLPIYFTAHWKKSETVKMTDIKTVLSRKLINSECDNFFTYFMSPIALLKKCVDLGYASKEDIENLKAEDYTTRQRNVWITENVLMGMSLQRAVDVIKKALKEDLHQKEYLTRSLDMNLSDHPNETLPELSEIEMPDEEPNELTLNALKNVEEDVLILLQNSDNIQDYYVSYGLDMNKLMENARPCDHHKTLKQVVYPNDIVYFCAFLLDEFVRKEGCYNENVEESVKRVREECEKFLGEDLEFCNAICIRYSCC